MRLDVLYTVTRFSCEKSVLYLVLYLDQCIHLSCGNNGFK
jgi:hypothetical protein